MIPPLSRDAFIRAETADEKARTVEIIWTAGATVRRRRFWDDDIDEQLIVTPQAVRIERLNSGAPFLNAHSAYDVSNILGVVVDGSVRIADGKGYATIRFSDREEVEPIFRDIVAGIIRNVSCGYRVHQFEIEKRDGAPELWRAVDWEPYEISAVPIGADPGAQIRGDGAEKYNVAITRRDEAAAMTANQKGSKMPETLRTPALSPDEIRASERKRIGLVRDLAKVQGLGDEWAERMIDRDVDENTIRESALAEVKKRTNADIGNNNYNVAPGALRGRAEPIEEFLSAKIGGRAVENHVAHEIGGRRFADVCRYYLRAAGQNVSMMNDSRMIGLALQSRSHQGTGDFAILLENVMHKELLKRTQREPSGIRQVAAKGTASDHRPQNRYRGGSFPQLKPYNEHGEILTGVLPDGAREKIQLSSRGSIVRLTRSALLNDDLGALQDFVNLASEGIEATISAQLAAIVEANPDLSDGNPALSIARGNVLPTGPALSETSLKDAKLYMRKQLDLNGERAGIVPKFLLVPPELEVSAQKLLASISATKTSDVNPHTDLQLVVEARLTQSTHWFVVADPAQVRGLEYAFLDGQETGMVEVRSGWEVDGMEIRSILDLGVAFIDPRGWVQGG